MIDMHSHIIYGVDDGSKNKEMTLEMLKLSIECGVKKIVATPHYMKGRFNVEYGEIKDKINELRQMVSEEKLDIEIYCGQEVYYRENILEYYEEGAIGTINDSRYMLIELPMREFDVNNVIDNLYELTLKGIVPIIAHPERYIPFIKKPSLINDFINSLNSLISRCEEETKNEEIMLNISSAEELVDTFYESIATNVLKEDKTLKVIANSNIVEVYVGGEKQK